MNIGIVRAAVVLALVWGAAGRVLGAERPPRKELGRSVKLTIVVDKVMQPENDWVTEEWLSCGMGCWWVSGMVTSHRGLPRCVYWNRTIRIRSTPRLRLASNYSRKVGWSWRCSPWTADTWQRC